MGLSQRLNVKWIVCSHAAANGDFGGGFIGLLGYTALLHCARSPLVRGVDAPNCSLSLLGEGNPLGILLASLVT